MLRSMTGFARAERATPAGLLAWEIRSVNHRYLEVGLRLPEELRALGGGVPPHHRRGRAPRQGRASSLRAGRSRPPAASSRSTPTCWTRSSSVRSPCAGASAPRGASTRWTCCAGRASCARPSAKRPARRGRAGAARRDARGFHRLARGRRRAHRGDASLARVAGHARSSMAIGARLPEVQSRIRAKMPERLAALGAEVNPERLEQEVAILRAEDGRRRGARPAEESRRRSWRRRSPPATRSAASSIS